MQPIHSTEAENRIGESNEEGNLTVLPSREITNPTEDDMAALCCIAITIYHNNDPVPENVPEYQYQHQGNGQEGGEVWKS